MEAVAVNISKTSQLKSALTNEKPTEIEVKEERVITWLDSGKACFLVKTKINVNDEWLDIGNTAIEEFKNTEESLKLLKNSVPEPFLTAVLAVLEVALIGFEIFFKI
jgi:hypothetical protein